MFSTKRFKKLWSAISEIRVQIDSLHKYVKKKEEIDNVIKEYNSILDSSIPGNAKLLFRRHLRYCYKEGKYYDLCKEDFGGFIYNRYYTELEIKGKLHEMKCEAKKEETKGE